MERISALCSSHGKTLERERERQKPVKVRENEMKLEGWDRTAPFSALGVEGALYMPGKAFGTGLPT